VTKVGGAIVVLSILKAERETEGGRLEKKKRSYTDGTMGWEGEDSTFLLVSWSSPARMNSSSIR
jgi:hypothetical protein